MVLTGWGQGVDPPVGLAALLWGDKSNDAKAHSSGKRKSPSSQTDAHPASASQPTLISRWPSMEGFTAP